jgi:ADP-heptose:LPS heptosyltransferase
VVNDGKGLDYFIPSNIQLPENALPVAHRNGYIALVIGASYASKKLPIDQLQDLCKQLNYPVVLIGGKEDALEGEQVASIDTAKVFNACGKFNLHESALIVQQSKTVLSHDTGFLYIACAYHKKAVAIWGATSPALQVEPYYPTGKEAMYFNAIVPNLSCQPCSNYGTKKCPKGHFNCMRHQNIAAIAAKANGYYEQE